MEEHEFKPILAEIQDKPPNPLGMWVLWTILILLILVIAGVCLVKVDVVVSARGKVIPDGDVKILQPLETGVIRKILVKEGDYVEKGQVLVEIDPTIEVADIEGKEKNLFYHSLTKKRVEALLTDKNFSPTKLTPEAILQTNLYKAQKQSYEATLKQKEKELKEIQSVIESLKKEVEKLETLISVVSEEEKRLKELVSVGAVAEVRYREKLKEKVSLERERDLRKDQIEENRIRFERIKHEIEAIKSGFEEKLLTEAGSSFQQENFLKSEITTTKFKENKKFIISPVNGYVHLLVVKTVGGIATPAQPIISIVPEDTPLVIRAIVLNKDIGFIKKGQKVLIKVDAYDFQKYGTINGEVIIVSPYSIEDREIGIDRYPVYINMHSTKLKTRDGKTYKIKPGMSVLAEINIGKRRVIELFLSPFIKHIDEGLKVR